MGNEGKNAQDTGDCLNTSLSVTNNATQNDHSHWAAKDVVKHKKGFEYHELTMNKKSGSVYRYIQHCTSGFLMQLPSKPQIRPPITPSNSFWQCLSIDCVRVRPCVRVRGAWVRACGQVDGCVRVRGSGRTLFQRNAYKPKFCETWCLNLWVFDTNPRELTHNATLHKGQDINLPQWCITRIHWINYLIKFERKEACEFF